MKKATLLLTIVCLFGTLIVQAREKGKESQKVGDIRAGWHAATLMEDGSTPDTVNRLNSFYIGFYRNTKLIPLLHLGSGIEYFQNGISYIGNGERV